MYIINLRCPCVRVTVAVLCVCCETLLHRSYFHCSSGRVTVNYTISSFSRDANHPLPSGHLHTLSSVVQWLVQSGWVGGYQVDPSSHFLLSESVSVCV